MQVLHSFQQRLHPSSRDHTCSNPNGLHNSCSVHPQSCFMKRRRVSRSLLQLPLRRALPQQSSRRHDPRQQTFEESKHDHRSHLGILSGLLKAATLLAALPASADVTASIATTIPGVVGDDTFREGVVSGFLLILFSELGDKTFFIALLLALRQSQGLVFAGTFGALAVMTVISVALGQVLHQLDELLPANSLPLDDIFAAGLLIFFGLKTLLDAQDADESAAEERDEAEREVGTLGSGEAWGFLLSTFALVFAAEWGDKSFLATIALAAASSPAGVVTGAVGGHGVATGIAVLGGSYLSRFISEKVVQYVGGILFLVFAVATIVDIVAKRS